MTGASPTYPTDVPYTFGYYDAISPMALVYVARLLGADVVDLGRPFRYLELGCGQGISTLTFAACFPHAEFVGVDMNEQHIDNARAIAQAGGLSNVKFHAADFASVGKQDIGLFDFITFHGVYAWVSAETRRDIRRIVACALAPTGIVYCSYNAMPGWAAIMPLRAMMQAYASNKGATSAERADLGVTYAKFLREHEAAYFAHNQAAVAQVDQLIASERHYVAHEYFTPDFHPFYFHEVAEEMGDIGLVYVGSSSLTMNHHQLSTPERFHEMLDTAPDRVSYETHRAFVLNERFRRDLYVRKGNHPLKSPAKEAWCDVLIGPLFQLDHLMLAFDSPAGRAAYEGPLYKVLVDILSAEAKTLGQLWEDPRLSEWNAQTILDGLKLLCASEQFGTFCAPMRPAFDMKGGARLVSRFNRVLLDARLGHDVTYVTLAAPVTGRGFSVAALAAVAVLGLDEGCAPDDLVGWAMQWFERRGITMKKEGKPVVGDECTALVTEQLREIQSKVLPRLCQYGILEPASARH